VTAERNAAEERERLVKSASDARDEAERQSRLKDDFLATLSHELRTPMNVILGWLDILSSGKPIRDLESTLALIQRNARLQAKLIDDLLDMNRLMSGNVRLDIASIDVGAALHATAKALQPAVDAKNIDLKVRLQSPPVEVFADPRLIQQVLWNLLQNAIKFTAPGGRVEASVERLDGEISVAVQDNGRGISASFLPHVFERFRQEDSSPTRESFGLGLGLSIAKHLVEVHGGSIAAHSDGPGRGATFSVRLPLASTPRTVAAGR
jgi:signal transduction histidine kinase